jgi:hypothetical protein
MSLDNDPIRRRIMDRCRIDLDSGCWLWTGFLDQWGHGKFGWREDGQGRCKSAEWASYECHVGPVPAGCYLEHTCGRKDCVNPAHLRPITHKEIAKANPVMAANLAKTHCPKGHPYDESNTTQRPGGGGGSARRVAAKRAGNA